MATARSSTLHEPACSPLVVSGTAGVGSGSWSWPRAVGASSTVATDHLNTALHRGGKAPMSLNQARIKR